jgi:hypothetical protein
MWLDVVFGGKRCSDDRVFAIDSERDGTSVPRRAIDVYQMLMVCISDDAGECREQRIAGKYTTLSVIDTVSQSLRRVQLGSCQNCDAFEIIGKSHFYRRYTPSMIVGMYFRNDFQEESVVSISWIVLVSGNAADSERQVLKVWSSLFAIVVANELLNEINELLSHNRIGRLQKLV